jgi:hypothetical protein
MNLSTATWNDVVGDTNIPVDLETSLLHFKTDSALGSSDNTVILYYGVDGNAAGGIGIWFSSQVKYVLLACQQYNTTLPVHLPDGQVKHWVLKKRGLRTVINCNGKQVLDITVSTKTCQSDTWPTNWARDVSAVEFPSQYDTASDSYHVG